MTGSKTLKGIAAALVLATTMTVVTAAPAEARWRRGYGGFATGLFLGCALGYGAGYYYGGPRYYYAPRYYAPRYYRPHYYGYY